jgi:hypothetical protein
LLRVNHARLPGCRRGNNRTANCPEDNICAWRTKRRAAGARSYAAFVKPLPTSIWSDSGRPRWHAINRWMKRRSGHAQNIVSQRDRPVSVAAGRYRLHRAAEWW